MARNTLILFIVSLFVVVTATAADRKYYQWTDEYGRTVFGDRPPPEGQGGKVEEKSLRVRNPGVDEPTMRAAASKNPVTLYVTTTCAPCDEARKYLRSLQVPFREVDVSEKNPDAQKAMREKVGELAVPTITVGAKVMKGFMRSLLDGELEQAGYPKPEKPAKPEGEGETEGQEKPAPADQ